MNQSNMKGNVYLQIGGLFSLVFSLFQVCGVFMPPSIIIYFGGPVKLQVENPALFGLVCVVLGVIIAVVGLYALSGAGKFRRLPFLRTVLVVVTTVFILRGLFIIPILKIMFTHPEKDVFRFIVFSIIALGIGVIHLIGVIKLFKHGRPEITVTK
jgi:putative oxidoreductase